MPSACCSTSRTSGAMMYRFGRSTRPAPSSRSIPRAHAQWPLRPDAQSDLKRRWRETVAAPARPADHGSCYWGSISRNYRQQQVRSEARLKVQCVLATEDFRRSIALFGVQKRTDAGHPVHCVGNSGVAEIVTVVVAPHIQTEAVARRNDDRGRPDLDTQLARTVRLGRLRLVMRMDRPVGQGLLRIQLAMRRSQPA